MSTTEELGNINITDNTVDIRCGASGKFIPFMRYLTVVVPGCTGCHFYKDTNGSIHFISQDGHRVCPFFTERGNLAPVGDQEFIDGLKRRGIPESLL